MKRFILIYIILFILLSVGASADVSISSTGKFILSDNGKVYLMGDLENNGVLQSNLGTLVFQGTTQDTLLMSAPQSLHNLTIDKSGSGFLELKSDITILGTLELRNGTLYTNSGGRGSFSESREIVFSESRTMNQSDSRKINARQTKKIEPNISRSRGFVENAQPERNMRSTSRIRNEPSIDEERRSQDALTVEQFLFSDSKILNDPNQNATREIGSAAQSRHLSEQEFSRVGRANGVLTMADDSNILRKTGSLSNPPTFTNSADIEYGGTIGVTTGNELPTAASVLDTLIINNSGDVTLGADVTVNGALTFITGDLLTGDYSINLGSDATVIEELTDSRVIGEVNTPATSVGTGSFNKLGVQIAAGDDIGDVTVTRILGTGSAITVGSSQSINCRWNITITGSQPLTNPRDITFSWYGSDDNSIDITTSQVWKSTDGGTTWVTVGSQQNIPDTDPRSITISTTSFSDWTVSDSDNPLPIDLVNFYADIVPGAITLHWRTESEYSNAGFYIYRDKEKISDLIEGHGTTSEPHEYSFVDKRVQPEILYTYQIADVEERTGKETLHPAITIIATKEALQGKEIPDAFALYANYPNPFNPQTTIEFDIPRQIQDFSLKIYDSSGKLVKTLFDEAIEAGHYIALWNGTNDEMKKVNSGVYYCKMVTAEYSEVRQLVLLK